MPCAGESDGGCVGRACGRAAKDSTDAGEQFARAQGLHDVIVSAQVEGRGHGRIRRRVR